MKRLYRTLLVCSSAALVVSAPAQAIERNVASQKINVMVLDRSTGGPKTGDAANISAYVSIDDGALTQLGDTSATELSSTNAPGIYTFDLTQAETNGKKLLFTGKSATATTDVVPVRVFTVPANFSTLTIANNAVDSDLERISDTAITDTTNQVAAAFSTFFNVAAPSAKLPSKTYLAGTNNADGDIQLDEATGTLNINLDQTALDAISTDAWTHADRTVTAATNITSTGGTTVPQTGDSYAIVNSRLPSSLTAGGNMKSDALALSGDTVAADNAESFFDGTGYGQNLGRYLVLTADGDTVFSLGGVTAGIATRFVGAMMIIRNDTDPTAVRYATVVAYDNTTNKFTVAQRGGSTFTIGTNDIVDIVPSQFLPGEVQLETNAALVANNLDHWMKVAGVNGDVTDDSWLAKILSKSTTASATSYSNTTDSLEANYDSLLARTAPSGSGAADSSANNTSFVDAERTETVTDWWKDSWVVFTSGANAGQERRITGFNFTTQTITFTPLVATNVSTETYVIVPGSTVAGVATDAIDADAIKADAIGAAEVAADTLGASEVKADALALVSGTADSGSNVTLVDTARSEADADYWKGAWLLFTSGNIVNEARLVTAFNAGTHTLTFTPALTQAVTTQDYVILPAAEANITSGGANDWSTSERGAMRSILGFDTSGNVVDPSQGIVDAIRDKLPSAGPGLSGGLPTLDTTLRVQADLEAIGDAAISDNADQVAAAFSTMFNVASPTLTAQAKNQTGDSYAIVNSGTFGNSALKTLLDGIAGVTGKLDSMIRLDIDEYEYDPPSMEEAPTGGGSSPDTIAAAVWDKQRSTHTTLGSFGEYVNVGNVLSGTIADVDFAEDVQIGIDWSQIANPGSTVSLPNTTFPGVGGGGGTVTAANVDDDHTWRFDERSQVTAPNDVTEILGSPSILVQMDFDEPMPAGSSIFSITSVTVADVAGETEPIVTSSSIHTAKRRVIVNMDTSAATDATFIVIVKILTTDSQTFTRRGRLVLQ